MRDITETANLVREKHLNKDQHYELWFYDNALIPFKVSVVKNGINRYERQGGLATICRLAQQGMNKTFFMHTIYNFVYEGIEIAEDLISEKIYIIDRSREKKGDKS